MPKQSERQAAGETAPNLVTYYAPDGSEYEVNEDTLTAVETVNLRSWGYSKEKPSAETVEANQVEVPQGGPLSGAAPNPDA